MLFGYLMKTKEFVQNQEDRKTKNIVDKHQCLDGNESRKTTASNIHCVSKKVPTFKLSITLSNLNRFSKFLHCWKAYEICNKTHTTLSTSA